MNDEHVGAFFNQAEPSPHYDHDVGRARGVANNRLGQKAGRFLRRLRGSPAAKRVDKQRDLQNGVDHNNNGKDDNRARERKYIIILGASALNEYIYQRLNAITSIMATDEVCFPDAAHKLYDKIQVQAGQLSKSLIALAEMMSVQEHT